MKNLDLVRFDWLTKQIGVKVEFVRPDQSLSATDIPWRVTLVGASPVKGRTLRIAIDRAMKEQSEKADALHRGGHGDS